jgi:choline dehydrogenase-like flavoprotein
MQELHVSIASPTSHLVDAGKAAADTGYDAVIVGSGVSGAIIAKELSKAGKRVLIVEAGIGADREAATYEHYMLNFYGAAIKDNQAPYPVNANADMPRGPDLRKLQPGETDAAGYIVQSGPYVTDTVFTRVFGGTTMHWEAKTPRMLPSDFQTRSMYDQGVDWPITYDELEPDYEQAEREIGVSADVEDQTYLDVTFPKDYVYPMKGLPLSYLDQMVAKGIDGSKVELYGEEYPISVRPFPQGRNGIPNPAYDGGKGFTPKGAVHNHLIEEGGRCQGNTNCVPICPVQARYHAGKTIAKALHSGRVDLLAQAVASRVVTDPDSGRVTAIEVKVYRDKDSGDYETFMRSRARSSFWPRTPSRRRG